MRSSLGVASAGMLALSACMGGGSTTSSSTSVSDINSSGTTVVSGRAIAAPFSGNLLVGNPSLDAPEPQTAAELRVEMENDEFVGVRLSVDCRTIIDVDSADEIEVDGGVVTVGEGGTAFSFRDPEDAGFEHQTYGVWVEGGGPTDSSGRTGSLVVGNPTPAGGVPSPANATYRGESIGWARLADGQVGIVQSRVTLATDDFSSIEFATTDTVFGRFRIGSSPQSEPDLDLSGTLTVQGAGFSGSISSDISSGTLNGRFYGPNAEEAGGLFQTTGNGGVVYHGGFGARR